MVVEECSSISLNDTECQQEAQTYCECCKAGLDVYNAFEDELFCSFFVDTREGNCLDIFLQCCAGDGEKKLISVPVSTSKVLLYIYLLSTNYNYMQNTNSDLCV